MSDVDSEGPPEALPLDEGDAPPPASATAASLEPATPRASVPVTLITGFLGAGKTTLVRHILTARHGRRIAVILNEFGGEGDIERAFVRGEGGDTAPVPQWVELANGCLCCSVKAEFLQALEALVAPGSAHAGKFDAVLIETTGLANPGPIIGELWSDEELEPAVSLDGVVAVVDAANVARQLAEARAGGAPNEAQLQVAMADVVLVNKVDLVSDQHLRDAEARLRGINAAARLVRCVRSAVDPGELFGCGGYRLRDASGAPLLAVPGGGGDNGGGGGGPQQVAAGWGAVAHDVPACGGGGACSDPSHDHGHHAHGSGAAAGARFDPCASHDASIRTVALRCELPVSLGKFTAWLEGLLWAASGAGHGQAPSKDGSGGGGSGGGQPADGPSAASGSGGSGDGGSGGGGGGGGGQPADGPSVAPGSGGSGDGGSGGGGGGGAQPEVLRLKGLVDVAGRGNAHMVQAVYEVYDIVEGPSWQQMEAQWAEEVRQAAAAAGGPAAPDAAPPRPRPPAPRRGTRLVAIGRRLDRAALQQGLEACAA